MSMISVNCGVVVDKQLVRFIDSIYERNNGRDYSLKLYDIDETFYFTNKERLQDFLNTQTRERFYDKELQKGYFDYLKADGNGDGDLVRYFIEKMESGRILEIKDFIYLK